MVLICGNTNSIIFREVSHMVPNYGPDERRCAKAGDL